VRPQHQKSDPKKLADADLGEARAARSAPRMGSWQKVPAGEACWNGQRRAISSVYPARGAAAALVLPSATIEALSLHLAEAKSGPPNSGCGRCATLPQ
jgi:hypothetical protein